ncbi:MAG: ribosome maturation factor RimP [Candidatus Omnitrophica bacterium]|nr:ribosome maturation factor RimP [Candidatus Omnitrophota bacterium]
MDRDQLTAQLQEITRDFLKDRELDLVDLVCRYEGNELTVRILTDRFEGGITVGECASVNKELGLLLDEKDILQERYVLEVSSPGLDRPLSTKNDFLRNKGKLVKFFLREAVGGKIEWDGVILRIENESVFIQLKNGSTLELPLAVINKGKRILE